MCQMYQSSLQGYRSFSLIARLQLKYHSTSADNHKICQQSHFMLDIMGSPAQITNTEIQNGFNHMLTYSVTEKKEKDNWMSKREELTDKDTLEINY